MNQAPQTIDLYLAKAVESIDKKFGEGYAKNNPQLVGIFIQSCVADYKTARLEAIGNDLVSALNDISGSIAHS